MSVLRAWGIDMGFWDTTTGWMIKCATWVTIFMAPARATMVAVGFLVLGDLVSGIWASHKRGEKFSSSKLRQTVIKTLGYQLALLLAFVTENVLLPELPVLKVVAGLIAGTELISAMENLSAITGVPLGDLVKKMFDKRPVLPVLPVIPVIPVLPGSPDDPATVAALKAAKVAVDAAHEAKNVAHVAALKAELLAEKENP